MNEKETNQHVGLGSRQHSTKAIWQELHSSLRSEIVDGVLPAGTQLPNEHQIASKFDVSRLTARRALSELQREGLIRIEQGRGTFVAEQAIDYKIASTMTFTQNLLDSHRTPNRKLVESRIVEASASIAEALRIDRGDKVSVVILLGEADGIPISLGKNYFPLDRFPDMIELFKKHKSFNRSFQAFGIDEPRRISTYLTARLPTKREARFLKQTQNMPVVETAGIDVDAATGARIAYSSTCFSANRVRFSVSQARET
ncbi:MAG: phosphonate metabolism transcriptional regulator PhnF [Mesorhizobium sp.]|nr:MAG: phosphonate metabolism transcriptional regulator PhnF [Mesorhizobium sp.]